VKKILIAASLLSLQSLLSLLIPACAAAETPAPNASAALEKKITALLEQLGDNDSRVRERATADLIAIGPDALDLVRRARETTDDLEVRARAERILQHISPDAIQERLQRTVIAELHDKDNNLQILLDFLAEESKRACPERIGFKFSIRGEPQLTAPTRAFRMRQVPLSELLKLLANRYNMAFTIERATIVFHPRTEGAAP
jgi:hypothetical protein